MGNHNDYKRYLFGYNPKTLILGVFLFIAVVAFIIWTVRGCDVRTENNGKIGITPVQIAKIRSIGQWEFLAISDEEIIDTIRYGFFGDDELSRIYYGTLRLGIDLSETKEDWISMDGDTITALLPPIKLLDENFLDEARTKAFFEEGKWTEADKAKLTLKAAQTMKARCLTPSNIRSAEQSASTQFSNLLRSMGFKFTKVRFTKQNHK